MVQQLLHTLSRVQGTPNCAFGGTANDGLQLLLSDPPEEGPQWVSLDLRRIHMRQTAQTAQQLSLQLPEEETYCAELQLADQGLHVGNPQATSHALLQLQRAREAAVSLTALERLESYFESNTRTEEQSQQLWAELPLHLQEFIPQRSLAWLDLRSRHLFTGSSAFLLLLCGTGGRQHRDWIPAFRRGAQCTTRSLNFLRLKMRSCKPLT
jgi:hypothetical protein